MAPIVGGVLLGAAPAAIAFPDAVEAPARFGSVLQPEGADFGVRNPFMPPRPELPLQFAQASSSEVSPSNVGSVSGDDGENEQRDAVTADRSSDGRIEAEVVGDDEFLPADELEVFFPSESRPSPRVVDAPEAGRSARWGLAPVRWGGALSAGFRYNWVETSADSRSQLYEGRLRVNSYIMQPYIALVSGDFGLTFVRAQSMGGGGAASDDLTGAGINGTGSVNVFPQSRFPFQATLALSDSRSDGTLTTTSTQQRRLSLRQDYRPPLGRWRTSGQYDRSELTGTFGRDTVDRLAGEYSAQFDRHALGLDGSWSSNRSSDGTNTDLVGVFRHGFRYDDGLAIDSSATYTTQDFDLVRGGLRLRGETQSAQIFSFGSWTPVDSKWRGTANVRYFDNQNDLGTGTFRNRNLGGSASLSYQASRNLSMFGLFAVNMSDAADRRIVTTNQNVGASYSSDAIGLGAYGYNWYSSASVSNSTSSAGPGGRAVNASIGHSLHRNWIPTEQTQLRGSVNQSISTNRSTGQGAASSSTLNNSVSLTLQAAPSDRVSGFMSATLSDSRTFGDQESTFQMLNTQLSGNWRIDAVSQMNSNLTWQLTRQGNRIELDNAGGASGDVRSLNSNLSGSLGYANMRFFGIRNLRYSADFRANTSSSTSRTAGDPDAGRDRVTLDLDQRLRYRIGRLDTELQARVGQVEGERQGLIFFKVTRDFGAF